MNITTSIYARPAKPADTAFARRQARIAAIRRAEKHPETAIRPSAETPAPFVGTPLDDTRFIAECAEGILNSLAQAVLGIDERGRVKTCNAAGYALLGLLPADILGRPAGELFVDDNAWVMERVAKVALQGQADATRGATLTFGTKRIVVNATVSPLTGADGMPLGVMMMLDDVTATQKLQTNIGHYLAPDLVDRLLAGDEEPESRDTVATILFADVRGFTALTEEVGAKKAIEILNGYFTLAGECIEAEGGVTDKFMGDGLMATFGAITKHDDDEDRAVRAAIRMLCKLSDWNAERASRGERTIEIGIGINTDTIVAGAIGSKTRMDYTMIGDGVNVAARIEGACKQYAARLLISEATYGGLRGAYKVREVDQVILQGRSAPVRIYELLDHLTEASFPNGDAVVSKFAEARRHYLAGAWSKATAAFWEVLALNPADRLADIYIQRCNRLLAIPPTDWTGVWALESK